MRKLTLWKRILAVLALVVLVAAVVPVASVAAQSSSADAQVEEEAGAEGGLLTPLGINAGLLFVQTFNFLLIAFILRFVLWKPLVNFLDARSARIQKGLEDAAAAAKARQNAEAEAEKIKAQARAEASKAIEEARGRGEDLAKQLETAAKADADKIREDARTEAKSARDLELAGLRDQVLNISVAVAGKIIGESLDAKKQKALVDDFFSKIPAGAKSLSGNVTVVSAMPLTDAEQNKAKKEIGADNVTFEVDPSILGGLVVRSQDRVIDGSVRSGLDDLAGRLN